MRLNIFTASATLQKKETKIASVSEPPRGDDGLLERGGIPTGLHARRKRPQLKSDAAGTSGTDRRGFNAVMLPLFYRRARTECGGGVSLSPLANRSPMRKSWAGCT